MRIVCVGGGPGGLYFAILMKKANPAYDILVVERNLPDDTFGFGVVFSDATMASIAEADSEAYGAIARDLVHWDDIDVHCNGEVVTTTGHGFSGMSRHTLLNTLQRQAREAGVRVEFRREVKSLDEFRDADLIVAADGVNSTIRPLLAPGVATTVDWRSNRFVWFGTTKPFPAFTFYFVRTAHGLWRVHAYQYAPGHSTFIVECREDAWRNSGMDSAGEEETAAFLEGVFATELEGHKLIANRSLWRQFPTIRIRPWSAGNVVIIGDAAHTAHFSVGSGTRLAMEDAVALRNAVAGAPDLPAALAAYEAGRRPQVESLQRAAQASLEWFEQAERYLSLDPVQFTFSLLTRSMRITHDDMRARDPAFQRRVDADVAQRASAQAGVAVALGADPPPPMFTPFRLRELVLPNRVVMSPMCQYSAEDGTIGDWHLVHLGSRAVGGTGLIIAEMTDISRDARISPGCAGIYTDAHAAAWKRIVDFVHRETPAKTGIQLGHAGRKASTRLSWEGDNQPLAEGGWPIMSASPLPYFPDRSQVPREMTRGDMQEVVADYARAAELALKAGFDFLELHMAHGYLLASFISPLTNARTDAYGGALENRLRFPLECFDACRSVWPAHKPMSVRISFLDWAPGGITENESVEVGRTLKAHGCDIIDVSSGQTVPHEQPVYGRLFQTPFADQIRHEAGIATMAVGNISSYMDVNTIIAAGRADLAVLARAHLFDPYWTRHAAWMQGYGLEWPNPYKSLVRFTPRLGFNFAAGKV